MRRRALRELARVSGLSYFTAPGIFGATSPTGGPGGGVWALAPHVEKPLTHALETSAPDWVALTEPAADLVSLVTERGCAVMHSVPAMGLLSLSALPDLPLPPGVTLQRVGVREAEDSISLEEALLVDVLHGSSDATSAHRDLPLEADALRLLPGITLLTAVDAGGNCVATAGTRVVGSSALVSAVATIPQYRRRGIAAALTSAALRAARQAGATRAFLDSYGGASVYARLGFQPIGTVTRCERPATET
jgi:GNAT superfamily N-acetyltransferase